MGDTLEPGRCGLCARCAHVRVQGGAALTGSLLREAQQAACCEK